jgi:hypothetical protein
MSALLTYISRTHSIATFAALLMGYDFFRGIFSEGPQELCQVSLQVWREIFPANWFQAWHSHLRLCNYRECIFLFSVGTDDALDAH